MWGLNCIVNIVIIIIIHPIIKWVFKRNIQKSFRDAFEDDIDFLDDSYNEDKQTKRKRLLREMQERKKMVYGIETYTAPKSERQKKKNKRKQIKKSRKKK